MIVAVIAHNAAAVAVATANAAAVSERRAHRSRRAVDDRGRSIGTRSLTMRCSTLAILLSVALAAELASAGFLAKLFGPVTEDKAKVCVALAGLQIGEHLNFMFVAEISSR